MSQQNEEQDQNLIDIQNSIKEYQQLQEQQIKDEQNNQQSGYVKTSRENSVDSARSRSRSQNERKRIYNHQQGEQKSGDSSINPDQSNTQRSNRFSQQGSESQQQQMNKMENSENRSNNPTDYPQSNISFSLQQLKEMANKMDVPSIKLESQAGYRHASYMLVDQQPFLNNFNLSKLRNILFKSIKMNLELKKMSKYNQTTLFKFFLHSFDTFSPSFFLQNPFFPIQQMNSLKIRNLFTQTLFPLKQALIPFQINIFYPPKLFLQISLNFYFLSFYQNI